MTALQIACQVAMIQLKVTGASIANYAIIAIRKYNCAALFYQEQNSMLFFGVVLAQFEWTEAVDIRTICTCSSHTACPGPDEQVK
jgi:hypothetical protein